MNNVEKTLMSNGLLISDTFDKWIDSKTFDVKIKEAVSYSFRAGGKRIRPALVIEAYKWFSENGIDDVNDILPYALAVEMIHTYSLIHDDLPSMDNDELRRGKPTSHIVFGEAFALLAGDALLNSAFEIMSDVSSTAAFDSTSVLSAIRELSAASGACGMIKGQSIDLQNDNMSLDLDELIDLHSHKTGALITASAKIGAILAGADKFNIDIIDKYAKNIGLAFQIIDDILDVEGNTALLGKSIGKDNFCNKITFYTLLGRDEAYKYAEKLTVEAVSLVKQIKNSEFFQELAYYLLKREF